MNIASETIVGDHAVLGRPVQIHRTTWRDDPGLSFDVIDAATGQCLTGESLDEYPTPEQMEDAVRQSLASGVYCRFCGDDVLGAGHLIGAAEPGTNPWCCDPCWDERLR